MRNFFSINKQKINNKRKKTIDQKTIEKKNKRRKKTMERKNCVQKAQGRDDNIRQLWPNFLQPRPKRCGVVKMGNETIEVGSACEGEKKYIIVI